MSFGNFKLSSSSFSIAVLSPWQRKGLMNGYITVNKEVGDVRAFSNIGMRTYCVVPCSKSMNTYHVKEPISVRLSLSWPLRYDSDHSGAVATQCYRLLDFPMAVLTYVFSRRHNPYSVKADTYAKWFIWPVLALRCAFWYFCPKIFNRHPSLFNYTSFPTSQRRIAYITPMSLKGWLRNATSLFYE